MEQPQVIYIDTTEAACRLLELRLQGRGFGFEAVGDLREAQSRLRSHPFDVVVVAAGEGPVAPVDLLETARERHPDGLRMQVVTDPSGVDVIDAVNRGGICRIVPRTWSSESLEQAIGELVEEAAERTLKSSRAALCEELEAQLEVTERRLDRLVRDYHDRILDGLMAVLGFRERGARMHCHRAARYAEMLGRRLRLSQAELTTLNRGALLHDLGKVGISDQILQKPGSLSESEWDEMRWHPALGHGLLSDFDFLGEARTIVLQHHERWDGTGYPNRLRGEDIHVGARITALADALDAMTTARPYRGPLPFDKAWREIQRCAGSQFDPGVVDAFVDLGPETWSQAIEPEPRERALALV